MPVPQSPFRAPIETPLLDKNGQMSFGWAQYFQFAAQQLKTPANQTPPALSNAPGTFGQIAIDGNFLYVSVGTTWKRIALANF